MYITELDLRPQNRPDWKEIFGNDRPLRVEIGPGKGKFLIEVAQREPQANYVAIEIRPKRVEKIRSKVARAELKNIQVYLGNAKESLGAMFSPAGVEIFFAHFPDPWPKRKHERRRLIDVDFVQVLYDLLRPDGKIYLTTDVGSYAETTSCLFTRHGGFVPIYAKVGDWDSPYHNTIHEWKFKLQQRTIYYFCYGK